MVFDNEELESFKVRYFQSHDYVFKAVQAKNLVGWDDLNNLLEKDILSYPRIRMANDNNSMSRGYSGFVTHTLSVTGEKSPHINKYQLYKNLNEGATLIIDRCHAFFPEVDRLVKYLSKELCCRSSANLYAAWSSTPSFGMHFDNHDVIALQIEGEKLWELHLPTHSYPMLSEKSFDYKPPKGKPYKEVLIREGEAIYLPAGYWHNVKSVSDRSLHISMPVIRPRKIDVIRYFLDTLVDYPELREPISLKKSSSDNNYLYEIIKHSLEDINISRWEDAVIDDCVNQNYVSFNLPNIKGRYNGES